MRTGVPSRAGVRLIGIADAHQGAPIDEYVRTSSRGGRRRKMATMTRPYVALSMSRRHSIILIQFIFEALTRRHVRTTRFQIEVFLSGDNQVIGFASKGYHSCHKHD